MKKLFLIIISFICLYNPFSEAKENWTIEHIWNDIILTYDWEDITLYDKTLDWTTQKCPFWYHIWSAEDYSNLIKLWYNSKWKDYKQLILKYSDFYKMEKSLNEDNQSWFPTRANDFNVSTIRNGAGIYASYKTTTKWINNAPYIFIYSATDAGNYAIYLKTCSKDSYLSCENVNLIRCFKDNKNTVINNWFSKEYNEAYIFAYNNKITTMPTIEQANMNWEIIRAEIAKMLSNWVKKFWYYADPNIPCNFTDTASVKWDLATAIIESCQYWIMWQWINQFRPYDKITKAEVATAVSRILWWTQYNWWSPFYINHVNALKNAWILTDNSNINSNELRWNVMSILMKANDIASDILIDCESSEFVLMCINDGEKCPEKCKNN